MKQPTTNEQPAANGHTTATGMVAADGNSYTFTEAERKFFEPQMRELNQMMRAMNSAASLICIQHGLEGAWAIKEDGTGLMRRDLTGNPIQ